MQWFKDLSPSMRWTVIGVGLLIVLALIDDGFAQGALLLGAVVVIYFVPWIVAQNRNAPNKGSVIVVNVFLGWTLIGWVVALAMAARDPKKV